MSRHLPTTHVLFRAFADETRLRVLNLLLEGELCVCDLCDVLKTAQPKVSRHLAYLRRAGLVQVRQSGKWKFYAIAHRPTGLRRGLFDCVRDCLREIDLLRHDLRRLAGVRRTSRCCNGNGVVSCSKSQRERSRRRK